MIYSEPMPSEEAFNSRLIRSILPTELRTRMLNEIAPALRQRAMFSAGVQSAEFLQKADDAIGLIMDGKSDRATQRMELKRLQGSLGADVDDTDITDTRSDARLELIIDHGVQSAQGYGHKIQGEDPAVLDQWPAKELIRVVFPKGGEEAERPWREIWAENGGTFFGDRMIALKSDPIWTAISDFGTDYAPFKFNSGVVDEDVDRGTAEDAELIGKDEPAKAPESEDFNAELQATPEVRAEWLRTALAESLQGVAEFDGEVLRISKKEAA